MPTKHKLGFGSGSIVEHEDGTAGYVPSGMLTQAFRVRVADVSGFSVEKGTKAMQRTLHVLGNGTILGSASVNHGVAEKVEDWFRAHPQFGAGSQATVSAVVPPPTGPPAGWYQAPDGNGQQWWDGQRWTEHRTL